MPQPLLSTSNYYLLIVFLDAQAPGFVASEVYELQNLIHGLWKLLTAWPLTTRLSILKWHDDETTKRRQPISCSMRHIRFSTFCEFISITKVQVARAKSGSLGYH